MISTYQQFALIKMGKAILRGTEKKPSATGNLLLDGLPIIHNKPFAVLQWEKSKLVKQGFNKNRLKIINLKP